MQKRIPKKSRHVRWNWEDSPDSPGLTRLHFIVVDDKERENKMVKILDSISGKVSTSYPFDKINSQKGKVKGSKFHYLFESYDTLYASSLVDLNLLFDSVKRDSSLYERKIGNIGDYVVRIYEED